jgi:hypothetical protein
MTGPGTRGVEKIIDRSRLTIGLMFIEVALPGGLRAVG